MAIVSDPTNFFQKPYFDKVEQPFFNNDFFKQPYFFTKFYGEWDNAVAKTNPPPPVKAKRGKASK